MSGAAVLLVIVALLVRRRGGAEEASVRLIDNEDGAVRLARAIASDIALYHAEECAQAQRGARPPGLQVAVDEGRTLFRARVAPALHRHFDDAVREVVYGGEVRLR